MSNYFKRYIKKYAVMVEPLSRLLKKDCDFIWIEEQEQAFDEVKEALVSSPSLETTSRHSDTPSEITCDASYQGI
jgi:hypothetical protein